MGEKLLLVSILLWLQACSSGPKLTITDEELRQSAADLGTIGRDGEWEKKNAPLITLGKKLYIEGGLSVSGKISCNSCHDINKFGVDGEKTSPGHDGTRGERNSPTSFNAALHFVQFWDGRAKDVEAQALGPILNPIEMGMPDKKSVVSFLKKDAEYVKMFKAAYPASNNPVTFERVGKAIGAFERTLITPARFDRFMKGDNDALTLPEKRGLQTFVEVGCTACHNGATVGGQMYQKLGVIKDYSTIDLGRFTLSKLEEERFVFKVPSLRNVAMTAPYLHDGSIGTLEKMIEIMFEYQLGIEPTRQQKNDVLAFLHSLTAESVIQ